jgi:hypothetical protein
MDRTILKSAIIRKIGIIANKYGPEQYTFHTIYEALLLDAIDRFVEHRIETDKVLIGILKEINNELNLWNLNQGAKD